MSPKKDKNLEDMVRYLKLEVPHYLGQNFTGVKHVQDFTYDNEGEIEAETSVYEVALESGEKVYAVKGGLIDFPMNDVYATKFPNPEIVSKFHLYITTNYVMERLSGLSGKEVQELKEYLEDFRSSLELPEEYVKIAEDRK